MKKVAKLVCVTLITRVIVNKNATEQEIMELAIPKLSENLMDAPFENIKYIKKDTECPYDPETDEPKKVFDGTYFDKNDEVIDTTQIDEDNKTLAWELFKEFGHKKKKGTYLEITEGKED